MQNLIPFAQHFINRSQQPCLFTDIDGIVLFANPAALEWLEIDEETLIGHSIEQAPICDQLREDIVGLRSELANTKCGTESSCTIAHSKENGNATLQATQIAEPEKNEPFGLMYCIESDQGEQMIDRIIVDNLLTNSDDMIYFKDLNSRFLRVSDSLVERFNLPAGQVCGKSDFDFFEHDGATEFYESEQEIIRTGEPLICQPEEIPGQDIWVLTSKMPLHDADGNIVGTFGISKDITAQKEFETKLEQTNKQLVSASRQAGMAEIATNVIHNVGNVLNSVNVSVSQVNEIARDLKIKNLGKVSEMISENANVANYLTEDEKGKRIPEYLSMIADELSRDREEIQNELAATKRHLDHIKTIVSMQQEFATSSSVVETANLSRLLSDAVQISSSSMARHKIELVREFDDQIMIAIDQHQVLQILINLIRNAKHACQASDRTDKQIVLSVELSEDDVNISISDNGIGIDPDNLLKLFSHGFTTKKHGHGFGLHSGANAAKRMGGDLQGFSEGLGKGATFVLTLPNQQRDQKGSEESHNASAVNA